MKIMVFDRQKKEVYEEKQFGKKKLVFLYNTILGRLLLKFFISKTYSNFNGKSNNKEESINKIKPFVENYKVKLADFEDKEYTSFNDFFTRKIKSDKRPISPNSDDLIAVADSKLLAYNIDEDLNIEIKNSRYTISELIHDNETAKEYRNGVCLVFRLTVDDYHRYIYFDDGKLISSKEIKGVLHTVTPIATKKYKVFNENYRICSQLFTKFFGEVMQIEIGAILVGKINNHKINEFKRGQEKGYFEFGGSTIVLLFKEKTIRIDEDIIKHSNSDIETKVKLGEKIGVRLC